MLFVRALGAMLVGLAIVPSVAHADAVAMTGDEISATLSGATYAGVRKGKSWSQLFAESGNTFYRDHTGAESVGRWRVENDRYCSLWPPHGNWVCYPMEREGDTLYFLFSSGERWQADPVD